ncbi:hypothetical protein Q3A66_18805 [Hymenobacter sp. BT770]|nr:hypothetical protein [Hymenobacter sp. BT770]MCC3155154.1 hypothetical protein [Hymenobacter sp. BT770]MDO3417123.1 hypothetical protein [Hymenobacter sp. BT770]
MQIEFPGKGRQPAASATVAAAPRLAATAGRVARRSVKTWSLSETFL